MSYNAERPTPKEVVVANAMFLASGLAMGFGTEGQGTMAMMSKYRPEHRGPVVPTPRVSFPPGPRSPYPKLTPDFMSEFGETANRMGLGSRIAVDLWVGTECIGQVTALDDEGYEVDGAYIAYEETRGIEVIDDVDKPIVWSVYSGDTRHDIPLVREGGTNG